MEPTAILTENPTFEDIKHNSLLFLRRNIKEMDEYLAGDRSPEEYEIYASLREEQRAKLQLVEAATCQEELREKESEQHPSTANTPKITRQKVLERQAAQDRQERLLQQATKLRGQTNRCSEEEKPALEAQIRALMYEHLKLDHLAVHPVL